MAKRTVAKGLTYHCRSQFFQPKTLTNMKNAAKLLVIALMMSFSFIACKKKTDPQVQSCFEDSYNGTYKGNGTIGGTPSSDVTITLKKNSCTAASVSGDISKEITGLTASSGGGYAGKLSDGSEVSISLSGSSLSLSGKDFSFSGSK
jgi:hypothetical protein